VLRRALVGAVVAVGLAAAAPAQATTPPRLTGESFHEDVPTITSLKCAEQMEWSSTGTATGPYPGTYVETGSVGDDPFLRTAFKASFVIYSPVGIVTGTKTGETGWGCASNTDCHSVEECAGEGASFNTFPVGSSPGERPTRRRSPFPAAARSPTAASFKRCSIPRATTST
jgi:hypothetical protein